MKKIIAAFDGLKYSKSTREHSIEIARQTGAQLVGLFLEDPAYHGYHIYDLISKEHGSIYTKKKHLEKKDQKTRAVAVSDFENNCRAAGLSYTIHKDRNIAIQELLKESIYADLVIIDPRETLSLRKNVLPTLFIQSFLPEIQCPVLLVPTAYKPLQKMLLLFDGAPSSVHAIKMLSYTLPEFKQLPVEVVTVQPLKEKVEVPDRKLMVEFMKDHFPKAVYTILKGLPETQILDYLKGQQSQTLVVLGAYRRGKVSRWFKPSLADLLMREVKLPLFIAHNK